MGEPVGRRRLWGGNLPGFFWAPQPLEEAYLAFFGRPGEDYWLLWRAGRTSVGGTHLAFWVAAPGFVGRLNPSATVWCLHLVPSLGAFTWAFTWCLRRNVPSKETQPTADQPTGKPSAVAASRFSGEQRLNAWGV